MITPDKVSSDPINIDAPAQVVWDVIVDFDSYHLWNRFCPRIEGILEIGAPIKMQVDLGDGLAEQIEYLTRIDVPCTIVWSMANLPDDPIHADRFQCITPLSEVSCTYVTFDEFGGDAAGMMVEAMGAQVEKGFNLCAVGLKARAEALFKNLAPLA